MDDSSNNSGSAPRSDTQSTSDLREFTLKKVSHEIRAPLAAIASILEAVTDSESGLSQEHRRMLDRAKARTASLMMLVDDLRRYWRLHAAPETLAHVKLDLADIVNSTVELFGPHAKRAGLELSCRCESCPVNGDEEMLREVATNLLANAIQYTPRGGRITLTLRRREGTACLEISDTGIGISPEAAAQLFKDFFRSPEAKAMFPDGTGLGLSIVKQVCELHGGRIDVKPRPGGGTTFTVVLPLDVDSLQE